MGGRGRGGERGGHFTPEMLGTAELVEEVQTGSSKLVKVGLLRIFKLSYYFSKKIFNSFDWRDT